MPAQLVHVHSDSDVVIRKRSTDRYVGLVFSGLLLLLFVIAFLMLLYGGERQAISPVYLLIPLLLFLAGFAASGPCEIHFDAQHRTYKLIRGMPLIARTVAGPLEDVKAVVCAVGAPNKGIVTYKLVIEWSDPARKPTPITYTSQTDAYPILDAVKLKLNIPTRWDE